MVIAGVEVGAKMLGVCTGTSLLSQRVAPTAAETRPMKLTSIAHDSTDATTRTKGHESHQCWPIVHRRGILWCRSPFFPLTVRRWQCAQSEGLIRIPTQHLWRDPRTTCCALFHAIAWRLRPFMGCLYLGHTHMPVR